MRHTEAPRDEWLKEGSEFAVYIPNLWASLVAETLKNLSAGWGGWRLLGRSVLCISFRCTAKGLSQIDTHTNPFSERPFWYLAKRWQTWVHFSLTGTQQTQVPRGLVKGVTFRAPRGEEPGRSGTMETFEHGAHLPFSPHYSRKQSDIISKSPRGFPQSWLYIHLRRPCL